MVISVVGIKSMPKFSKNKKCGTSFTAFKAVNIQCNDEKITSKVSDIRVTSVYLPKVEFVTIIVRKEKRSVMHTDEHRACGYSHNGGGGTGEIQEVAGITQVVHCIFENEWDTNIYGLK